jgi:hypothetical protein
LLLIFKDISFDSYILAQSKNPSLLGLHYEQQIFCLIMMPILLIFIRFGYIALLGKQHL